MAFPYGQPNYGGMNNYANYQPNYQPPVQPQQPLHTQQPQMQYAQPMQAVPQNVNKIYVTSLEDALARFSNVNTITVYHLQDESGEIEVATDGFGKKSYKMRRLSDFAPVEPKAETPMSYATYEQFTALENRISAIETQMTKPTKSTSNKKAEVSDNE